MSDLSRRNFMIRAAALGIAAPTAAALLGDGEAAAVAASGPGASLPRPGHDPVPADSFHPVPRNLPVGPHGAPPATASFFDSTAAVTDPFQILIGQQVYVGPFARLLAEGAPIRIGGNSNIGDSVTIVSRRQDGPGHLDRDEPGVLIGGCVIIGHGATVKGPAVIGSPGTTDTALSSNVSFGAEVDGATIGLNCVVGVLARVGPGVVLPDNTYVLPGRNVTTQAEATDLTSATRKVRPMTAADTASNQTVLAVNTFFTSAYSQLAADAPDQLWGISVDPAGSVFNPTREAPTFAGRAVTDPRFRNRIIGDVRFTDQTKHQISRVLGDRVAVRADEGTPFTFGTVDGMGDRVIIHALRDSSMEFGNNVRLGRDVVVHGGGRKEGGGGAGTLPTVFEDDVTLADGAVAYRVLLGRGTTLGRRSVVVASDLAAGTVVPDRTVIMNNVVQGYQVEW